MTEQLTTPLKSFDFRQLPTSASADINFSRTSEASFYGSDGYLHFAQPGYNMLINSQDLSANGWNQVGTSVSATGSVPAADGSYTASKVSEKTVSGEHRVSQSVTVVKGRPVTISIYVKAGTRSKIQFSFVTNTSFTGGNPGVRFNLSNGSFISSSSNVTSYQAVNAGDGWWRLRVTATPDRGSSTGMHLYLLNDDTEMSYGVSTSRYIYAWGAQIEQSATMSAYTPTTVAPYFGLRYHYDLAGTPSLSGVLIEPAGTNLIRYSHNIDNVAWQRRNISVGSSGTRSPDGTLNAFKIKEDYNTSMHYVAPNDNVAVLSGSTYTLSAFLKAAERKWAYFNISGLTVHFDLGNGVVGIQHDAFTNAGMEKAGGGWYRCFATFVASGSSVSTKIGPELVNGTTSYKGDGSGGILMWGVQLEKSKAMTSYIRTKGSAASRGEDSVTLTKPTADDHNVLIQRTSGETWIKDLSGNLDVPTSGSTVKMVAFYDTSESAPVQEAPSSGVTFKYATVGPSNTLVSIFAQRYMAQTPNKSWSLQQATNVASPVFRFEIRSGDRWSGDLSNEKIKERCEFYMKSGDVPFDKDVWLSYSIRIAPGAISQMSPTDFCYLGQFHATEDSGEMSTGPVLGVRLEGGDKIAVYTASSTQNPIKTAPTYIKRAIGTFTRGQWHRIVMRIRFSPTRGQLQWWQNGQEMVNVSNIGIGYVDKLGPYWKFGIYRMAKPETLVVEYANMELSYTSSLYGRVSKPLTIA
ncbi:phage head spike fiber domain-containing protein [Dyadobacter sandarakinus]|uniref:Heparin lyase I family protein n=1 Tax=Dyadobacter sandarakinus TaxID=2747268 RepID=A0ABX7I830_9BACT|nr:heparin lyase I family protein [Dyadobacter sandarakinus]QRR01146.1 heparin lyase I family protein [Dyadobacter sandarakinus]